MSATLARRYHQRTRHTVEAIRSGGRLDLANRPRPHKLFADLAPVALPRTWPEPTVSAGEILADGHGPRRTLDLAGLARVLFLSGGVTRRRGDGQTTTFLRAAPSAGALYPVELYAVTGALSGLDAGVYHFEPVEFVLRRLRRGDLRAVVGAAGAADDVADRPASLLVTGIPWRTTWKYGPRGYRHLFWDAGTVLANTLVAAASAGLDARVLTAFEDDSLRRLLDLDAAPFKEYPLAVVALGTGATAPPAVDDVPELGLRVLPLSPRPVEAPGLDDVHRAGDLADRDEVATWRAAVRSAGRAADAHGPPPPRATATVDEVILRRGSTRRFDPDTVLAEEELRWPVATAARAAPLDATAAERTWLTTFLSVHAVDQVPPGTYRWSAGDVELLRRGRLRQQAAHLCLDQPLGGDAAYTAFLCADLDRTLAAGGARAYRVAQLEAGIAAGRLQLASFALGRGGTGLTFYDDEIRRTFRTDLEPMMVAAIGQPAYRAHRGRRPSELPPVPPDELATR
ncbi:MAG TPA: SagB/ThcOx family dehydrogenase [Nitriliruptorales bacterium]|nr:SagB/ThcOx family dehydrogenase [Nitriliruptorales bacterium]